MSWGQENGHRFGKVSTLRRFLPQFLAASANNILLVDIGASTSFATIIISALLGATEGLSMTDLQASWMGSICFMCQPIGSILSGTIVEVLGRKRAMMAVNIPHIVGWIMLCTSQDVGTLLAATALLGFGIGLMEASIFTYIGEISEPSIRGTLVTYSTVFLTTGQCGAYFLGTILPWRIGAAACLSIPIINIIAVCFVPESPSWLLARGRDEDAIQALQWLRGWTERNAVLKEYKELKKYNEYSLRCQICDLADVKADCPHEKMTEKNHMIIQSLRLIFKRETLRPLALAVIFFGCYNFTSVQSIKPNMVNIFRLFKMPIDEHWASVGVGVVSIIATFISMCLIKMTGKRPLMMVCMAGSAIVTFLIGAYAFYQIPHDISSYGVIPERHEISWTPLVLFTLLMLFYGIGIVPIAWVLMSEVFPYRKPSKLLLASLGNAISDTCISLVKKGCQKVLWSLWQPLIISHGITNGAISKNITKHLRSLSLDTTLKEEMQKAVILATNRILRTRGHACGIAAASCYVWTFLATKTFINVEHSLHLYGSFYLYALITLLGLIFLYFFLPETEHRTNESIEKDFSCKKIKIFPDDPVFRKVSACLGVAGNAEENKLLNPILVPSLVPCSRDT